MAGAKTLFIGGVLSLSGPTEQRRSGHCFCNGLRKPTRLIDFSIGRVGRLYKERNGGSVGANM